MSEENYLDDAQVCFVIIVALRVSEVDAAVVDTQLRHRDLLDLGVGILSDPDQLVPQALHIVQGHHKPLLIVDHQVFELVELDFLDEQLVFRVIQVKVEPGPRLTESG